MARIGILVHRDDDFDGMAYVLRPVAKIWRDQGHSVSVFRGPREVGEADIAILHVDLTIVPSEYVSLAARFPKCINRYTSDISKRSISRQLVRPGDGYDGPVIVKANLNCGGLQEAKQASKRSLYEPMLATIYEYQVLQSPQEVPDGIWHDAQLVVERFFPEREGDCYCVRRWYFLGSKGFHLRAFSHHPVIKGSNTIRREVLDEVPDELIQIKDELGFEYGKFDYTVCEGKVRLFDVNRTPTTATVPQEMVAIRNQAMAEGINEFL